jgi:hypothetical protein
VEQKRDHLECPKKLEALGNGQKPSGICHAGQILQEGHEGLDIGNLTTLGGIMTEKFTWRTVL